MTTIFDISLAAAFYIFPVIGIILLFSVLLRGVRHVGPPFLWRQWRSYVQLFGWMLDATKITDSYLIAHSGLDSVVYLRLYLIGLKIFSPIAIVAGFTLIPVNSGNSMETDFLHINVDRFMMTNIPDGSNKLWVHFMMAYVFSAWTCYVLHREYKYVLSLRKGFYASGKFHPELFTVLVQNIPHDPQKSTSEVVNHFFIANHGEQYLGHKIVYKTSKLAKMIAKKKIMENRLRCYSSTCRRNPSKKPSCWIGLLRLFGCTPDAIKSYNSEIDNISSEIKEEHQRLKFDTTCMMQTALVSFRTQWGAAVCAKTLQHDNPFIWLTKQAPEPKDIYWENLGVNSISTATRELGGIVAFLFILIGSTIPLSVISLQIMKLYGNFPLYLEPISFRHALEVVMQGFIPGIFLDVLVSRLCHIFRYMVKFEGCTSRSSIERRSAIRFYIFLVVDGCFGCLLYGAANKQLKILYKMPLYETLRKIALVVPNQFIFFVTLVMFEGWVARAWELLEFEPLSRLIKFVCSFYYNTERGYGCAGD